MGWGINKPQAGVRCTMGKWGIPQILQAEGFDTPWVEGSKYRQEVQYTMGWVKILLAEGSIQHRQRVCVPQAGVRYTIGKWVDTIDRGLIHHGQRAQNIDRYTITRGFNIPQVYYRQRSLIYDISWVRVSKNTRGPIYHVYRGGGQYTRDRGSIYNGQRAQHIGRGPTIPWLGVRYIMDRGVQYTMSKGSKYHIQWVQYSIDRVRYTIGRQFDIPWIGVKIPQTGGSICHV